MQYAALKELTVQIKSQYFPNEDIKIVGTGGFVRLFDKADLFDDIRPDLVLEGLFVCLKRNR